MALYNRASTLIPRDAELDKSWLCLVMNGTYSFFPNIHFHFNTKKRENCSVFLRISFRKDIKTTKLNVIVRDRERSHIMSASEGRGGGVK